LPYEQRKRARLLEHIPTTSGVIVELGCADGHNLGGIATSVPTAQVCGLDISVTAVAAAARRTPRPTRRESPARRRARCRGGPARHVVPHTRVLVIAETLYYLGSTAQIQAELGGLAAQLAPHATVILVHQASDANRLHEAAQRALGRTSRQRLQVADPDRPYVIEIASPQLGPTRRAAGRGP
jgi:trans-aconitate methyltransferase